MPALATRKKKKGKGKKPKGGGKVAGGSIFTKPLLKERKLPPSRGRVNGEAEH